MHQYFYGHSDWHAIDDADLIDQICAAVPDVETLPDDLSCKKRSLAFYNDTDLVIVKSPAWEVKNLFIYFLYKDDQLVRLDGTSPPIHSFNANHIKIADENADLYLEFFCFFVRGEEGPFLIIDSLENPYLPKSVRKLNDQPGEHYKDLARVLRKPRAYGKDGSDFRYSATVYYSNAVFVSDFVIKPDGMIEMLEDEPVIADLPHKIDAPIVGNMSPAEIKKVEDGKANKTQFFETKDGRRIAFHQAVGNGPGVVFLGGLKSDMNGTKAMFLEKMAREQGRAFLRFDYTGHGESSGGFTDGCISDWARDAADIISEMTKGPQVFVGSSMGGWIALLLARDMPERFAKLVTIAAAPDFTQDSMWAGFNKKQRAELNSNGRVELPSDYGEPYVITKKLIEDGRDHLVLQSELLLPFPVHFLQGTADKDVAESVALRLLDHASGDDIRLTLVKGADHRFSSDKCLSLIATAVAQVS